MTQKPAATCGTSFKRLLKDLLQAFPRPISLDYFAYAGVMTTDVLMDEDQVSRFEEFASFTSMLHALGIINASKFTDAPIDYLWNVCLTADAYDAFQRDLQDMSVDDPREIISTIVSIHRSNTQSSRILK